MIAQFMKSARGSWAYVLASKISVTENFPQRDDQIVGGARAAQLVCRRIDLLRFAAQIERLTEEQTLQTEIGSRGADLVGFAAGERRDAEAYR
jgi:hypothetical protein